MKFNNMTPPYYWFWFDIQIGRFWYVLMWVKGGKPLAYRSTDATPPMDDNDGKWFFGGWRYL